MQSAMQRPDRGNVLFNAAWRDNLANLRHVCCARARARDSTHAARENLRDMFVDVSLAGKS